MHPVTLWQIAADARQRSKSRAFIGFSVVRACRTHPERAADQRIAYHAVTLEPLADNVSSAG